MTSRTRAPTVQVQGPTTNISGSVANTDQATALYSDIAASRPPSPRREKGAETVMAQDAENDRLGGVVRVESNTTSNLFDTNSSYEGEHHERDENDSPWTTVTRKNRRARSLSSLDKARAQGQRTGSLRREFTREQAQTIATEKPTVQQKDLLRRRQLPQDDPVTSEEEGPSKLKGKGIDPREWGNVNISRESLDIEAQAAALESIKKRRHRSAERRHQTKQQKREKLRNEQSARASQLPAESRPVNQIAKNSYLGAALRDVGQSRRSRSKGNNSPHPSDPSSGSEGGYSSEDDSSSGSGSETDSESDQSSRSDHQRRKNNRHGRNHRK